MTGNRLANRTRSGKTGSLTPMDESQDPTEQLECLKAELASARQEIERKDRWLVKLKRGEGQRQGP